MNLSALSHEEKKNNLHFGKLVANLYELKGFDH